MLHNSWASSTYSWNILILITWMSRSGPDQPVAGTILELIVWLEYRLQKRWRKITLNKTLRKTNIFCFLDFWKFRQTQYWYKSMMLPIMHWHILNLNHRKNMFFLRMQNEDRDCSEPKFFSTRCAIVLKTDDQLYDNGN